MSQVINTSFLFALTNSNDQNHSACVAVARTIKGWLIIPACSL